MNPLTLITISFIISYFLNFHICLYSQNVLTFISTKIPETFYFHISVSISIYFEFPYHDPQEQLKKEFRILDKDFSTSSLQIYIKKFSITASSERKTPPLLQVIQRHETNSKAYFVIDLKVLDFKFILRLIQTKQIVGAIVETNLYNAPT